MRVCVLRVNKLFGHGQAEVCLYEYAFILRNQGIILLENFKENAMRRIITLAMLTMVSPLSFASDIQPGLWELALEMRVAASPGFSPAPYTMKQCLTAQDAQDPSRILGSAANPMASDCTYTEKTFAGSTFRFKMQCAGSLGMQASGEITYSAASMEGSIVSTANMNGQSAEFQSRITARRLGGC